ncbi:hypothetical protein N9891_02095 [bacterium]|nr:hypothetical protein [bacterium]
MKWLLDTSVFSQPLKKSPDQSVLERWKKVGDRSCLTSIVVTLNHRAFARIEGLEWEDWGSS